MEHYKVFDEGIHGDQSFPGRPENEEITITFGYRNLDRGYFVKVSSRGLCVVAFSSTKTAGIRKARRAWHKVWDSKMKKERGYPRVVDCGEESSDSR